MKKLLFCAGALVCFAGTIIAQNTNSNLPGWITRPLSLADSLNLALQQNATILKAKNDLEASYGIVVQTRAVALPRVQATGNYTDTDPEAIDYFPISLPLHVWNGKSYAMEVTAQVHIKNSVPIFYSDVLDLLMSWHSPPACVADEYV